MQRLFIVLLFAAVLAAGCMPSPYYQKQYSVPGNAWKSDFQPTFKVQVTDSASLYELYFIIRHTNAYPFSNIWMWVYTKAPGDTTFAKSRIQIPLATESGQWLGRGMGEIWEHRMPISHEGDSAMLRRPGTYEFRFEQNMRVDPLPEVLQVGLRVEKSGSPRPQS
jgi:gliding motility-associated lipoprotein GldH